MGGLREGCEVGAFLFTAFFTAASLAMALAAMAHGGWEATVAFLLPAAGALFMRITWREWQRLRSLRTEVEDGYITYVWAEGGREMRSHVDPRPGWDHPDTYV
jgi:hypothetical protein